VASQFEKGRIDSKSERERETRKTERSDVLIGIFFVKEVYISLDILSRRVMQKKKSPDLISAPIWG